MNLVLLSFLGEPDVTLSNSCHGDVRINNIQVCSTHWNNGYSHLVCQEKGCSNAIADIFSGEQAKTNEDYYHVNCENYHDKLGQCKRFLGKCNGKVVSVNCVSKYGCMYVLSVPSKIQNILLIRYLKKCS